MPIFGVKQILYNQLMHLSKCNSLICLFFFLHVSKIYIGVLLLVYQHAFVSIFSIIEFLIYRGFNTYIVTVIGYFRFEKITIQIKVWIFYHTLFHPTWTYFVPFWYKPMFFISKKTNRNFVIFDLASTIQLICSSNFFSLLGIIKLVNWYLQP